MKVLPRTRIAEKKINTVMEANALPQNPGPCRNMKPITRAISAVAIEGVNAPRHSDSRQSRSLVSLFKIHLDSLRREIELRFVHQEGDKKEENADQRCLPER